MGPLMRFKIALLLIGSFAAVSSTTAGEFPPARNCTWCHGTEGEVLRAHPDWPDSDHNIRSISSEVFGFTRATIHSPSNTCGAP